jgi:ribonuclease Z
MYGDPEKLPNAKEHRHMMIEEACRIARDSEVQELWLTHYSPSMTHPEEYESMARKIFPNTVFGKDGMSTELAFDE